MSGFVLTKDQQDMRRLAAKFGEEVMRPAAKEYDLLGETPLDMRDVQQEEKCCIQAGQARDAEAQDVACSFDGRSVLFNVR